MKRRTLHAALSHVARSAGLSFQLVRHGEKHDVYVSGELSVVVPRHRDINERTAHGILAEVEQYVRRQS